ncbi:tetratricopeptide repeat protein [Xylophilus ampelinus]|uniref:Tetratricopeptide (TPR) repeat protein n=1 Tax=Xylophilus ampelinus TaxID=54067 RepID=A0A318SZX8_9BURK|nr:tetratricopeptide repeat protein [Xylophilus ampelinus]MCS4509741.1 tetratricopeptide repeat protein [Xylophilus ampelinus]PYE78731.1 tetratricopeptide (TPR) repeat protein [Xylophilus ampelinus]
MTKKTIGLLAFLLLLAIGVLAVYLPGLHNELVFDDLRLTDGTIFGPYDSLLNLQQRLLSYGSFVWLDAVVGPGWWKQRLFNILLHLGTTVGLYFWFRQLLLATEFSEDIRAAESFSSSRIAALRVGVALFALNPVAVYGVAYLLQRSVLMATFFAAWSCYALVRGLRQNHKGWLAAAVAGYILAVLAKEHTVMLVAFFVPLYIFVKRPGVKQIAGIAAGCMLLLALAVYLLAQVYGSFLGRVFDPTSLLLVQQLDALRPGLQSAVFPLSILNEAFLFFRYGVLWFLPNPQWMSIDMRPAFPLSPDAFPQLLGALAYGVLLVGSAWLVMRRSNALGLAALCLLFPLLLFGTEFATVWVQDPLVLYRSYLWAAAIPGLIALPLIGFAPKTVYTVGFVVGALFGGLALERVLTFESQISVWSDAVEKVDLQAPANAVGRWRPYLNRGAQYLEKSLTDSALADFTMAERLGEPRGLATFNKGVALQLQRKHTEAIAAFRASEAKGNHGAELYYQLGESLYETGRFTDAYTAFSRALELYGPPVAENEEQRKVLENARLRHAETAITVQKYDVALQEFSLLLQNRSTSARFRSGYGLALLGAGRTAEALAVFDKLIADRPFAQAFYGRALARHALGNTAGGVEDMDKALSLDPRNQTYQTLRAQMARLAPKR